MSVKARLYAGGFLIPLMAALAVMAGAPSSALAANGSVSGTVTDSVTAAGVNGVTVQLEETSQGNVIQTTTTGTDGTYSFTAVPDATDYVVEFNPGASNPGATSPYNDLFYNGATSFATATPVTVAGAANTPSIDGSLTPQPGDIAGTVQSDAGNPESGIVVDVENASGTVVGTATTTGGGGYDVTGLTEGTYFVQFNASASDQLGTEFYNGKTTLATADPVSVTPGTTTSDIDGSLPTGHISGTVTAATGGTAITGVTVTAQSTNGSQASSTTAPDGTYTLTGLGTGNYTVSYQASGQNFVAAFYSNRTGPDTADLVSVTGGSTTAGINEALQTGATVSGTVSGAGAGGLQNAGVTLLDASGAESQYCEEFGSATCAASTAADGTYTIQGLPAGSYYLRFDPPANQDYLTQYYNGETSFATADTLSLASGQAAAGVNASLPVGGQISGTVTNASTGAPAAGVNADAVDSSGDFLGEATTNASGVYTIMGLMSGSYKVEFSGNGFVDEFYGGTASLRTATSVGVTQGTTTGSINQAVPPATSGGTITGTVTSSTTGLPISGVRVNVYDPAGNALAVGTSTRSDGTYTIPGVLAGTYKVGFGTGSSFGFQYFNGKSTLATANAVAVAAGGTTPGVNAALSKGGTMTGTVTDGTTHAGLGGVDIELVDVTGNVLDSATTNPNGTYTMTGIAAGSYHVEFDPGGNGLSGGAPYAVQYYNDKITLANSDPVAIAAGATTPNINAGLVAQSSVVIPTVTPTPPATPTTPAKVAGKPTTSGTGLSGLGSRKANLKFKLAAGNNGAPQLKSFKVKLPKGLSFITKGLKKGLKVTGGGKFTDKITKGVLVVTLKKTASKLTVSITSKAISVTKALAQSAKKGKDKSEVVTLTVTDSKKKTTTVKLTFKKPK